MNEVQEFNVTLNNALWLGFRKATPESSLSDVVKGYIGKHLQSGFPNFIVHILHVYVVIYIPSSS